MSESRRLPAFVLTLALALAVAPAWAQDDVAVPAVPGAAQPAAPRPAAPELGTPPPGVETATPAVPGMEPPPPIYEDQLLRLSEILGSLTFLRDLCGSGDGRLWRAEMGALLDAEHPGPNRRAHLVGRFNHGYEAFSAGYRSCTPAARLSIARYLAEGQKLSATVRSRYSQ